MNIEDLDKVDKSVIKRNSKMKVANGIDALTKLYSNIRNLTDNDSYNLKFHKPLEIFREATVVYDNIDESRENFISIPILCRTVIDTTVYTAAILHKRNFRTNSKISDYWDDSSHSKEKLRQLAISLSLLSAGELKYVEQIRKLGSTLVHPIMSNKRGYGEYKKWKANPKKIKVYYVHDSLDTDVGKELVRTRWKNKSFNEYLSEINSKTVLKCLDRTSYYTGLMIGRFMSSSKSEQT